MFERQSLWLKISLIEGRGIFFTKKEKQELNSTLLNVCNYKFSFMNVFFFRRGIPAENVMESQYCRHEWLNDK